jgi:hypothetical protein
MGSERKEGGRGGRGRGLGRGGGRGDVPGIISLRREEEKKKKEKKKEEEKIQSRIHSHPDDEASKEDAIELITHAQVLQQ